MIRIRVAFVGIVLACAGAASFARHSAIPEDILDKPISLDGKRTTFTLLSAEVKKQTGLTLKAPTYVQGRRITIAVTGQSARTLLDALCELEGWSWRHSRSDGVITIDGPVPGVRNTETMYGAIRRLTPPDLVAFFRMPPAAKVSRGSGNGRGEETADQRADVERRLKPILRALEPNLEGEGVKLSELKTPDAELVHLAVMLSIPVQRANSELAANSDWTLARPDAARLRVEKGSILMVDCDLGKDGAVASFGANTATRANRNP